MSISSISDLLPDNVNSLIMGEHERRSSDGDITFPLRKSLRPIFKEKFRAPLVKQIIQQIVNERLEKAIYNKDQAPGWANEIAEEIKKKLLELDLNRYKYVVNVTILENKGAGVRMQVNCLWDSDTDNLAQDTFKNDTIICVVMAFGVYLMPIP